MLVTTCHLQTFYNFLQQLVARLCITSFDNQLAPVCFQLATDLSLTSCRKQGQTHPDIGLLITSLLQDVNRLGATCAF